MRPLANRFSRWHAILAACLWFLFSGWTLLIVSSGLDAQDRTPARIAKTTAAVVFGPMTGAVSRDFQSCCLEFSVSLLPYCGVILTAAVAAQFLPGRSRVMRGVRLTFWTIGLVAWFGGGIVSFAHALS